MHHIAGIKQRADILTKALGKLKFGKMRELIGVEDVLKDGFKLQKEIVG